ncbi:hypothetical protein VTO73DRAFT_7074 [Trametes versicolor]
MSWQAYVDNNLIGTGKIQKAAIIGLAGGVWASSPGYTLSAEEQKAIVTGYENPSSVQASGVRLAGQKFFTLQANERSIYGKKAVRVHGYSRSRPCWWPSTPHRTKRLKRRPSLRAWPITSSASATDRVRPCVWRGVRGGRCWSWLLSRMKI